MMKRSVLFSLLLAAAFIPFSLKADTVGAAFQSNVTVPTTCTLGTTNLEFPDYDGTQMLQLPTQISVNCLSGIPYSIVVGAGSSGDQLNRSMQNTTATTTPLNYNIFNATTGQIWGDGTEGTLFYFRV